LVQRDNRVLKKGMGEEKSEARSKRRGDKTTSPQPLEDEPPCGGGKRNNCTKKGTEIPPLTEDQVAEKKKNTVKHGRKRES